jgi:hypothetical protein
LRSTILLETYQSVCSVRWLLEPVCKIGKEENGSNGNHGSEIHSSLFIASGNATELLETIDETFHNISLSVVLFIERTSAPFVAASSNGAANMITMEIASQGRAGVAFVCHQTLGSQAPMTRTSANGTLLHQFFCLVDVTFLTRRKQETDQSAGTFTTNMDFGAETTTRTP